MPRPVEGFRLEEIDGEILLYHPQHTRTVYLNGAASVVWRLCDGERSIGEIVGLLRDAFPEERNMDDEVPVAVRLLAEHGAVRLS